MVNPLQVARGLSWQLITTSLSVDPLPQTTPHPPVFPESVSSEARCGYPGSSPAECVASFLPQPQRVKIPDGRAALWSARSGKAGGELDGNSRLELPARNLSRDPRARSKAMAHLMAACHVRRD
jgi:hypothetical protein